MDSSTIRALYENVLQDDVRAHSIRDNEIRIAINNMKEVYKPDPASLQSNVVDVANYDDVVHRCAYLHKYAPLHTALVSEMLQLVMRQHAHVFQAILNKQGSFNVCSLGGGPGNDVIAVLDVLHTAIPGYYQVNATIVDIMVNWKFTFESILNELSSRDYGPLSDHVSEQYFSWRYEKANLLSKMTDGANRAIASANLITMVKFVSASSCKDTATMIRKVFRCMKQGAFLLYIDNAGGGFHQVVSREAAACRFASFFGPLKHHLYSNPAFNVKKFGYTPCLETTVSVHLWRKPFSNQVDDYINSLASGWWSGMENPGDVDLRLANHTYAERSRPQHRSGGRANQNRSRRSQSRRRRPRVEEEEISCCTIL